MTSRTIRLNGRAFDIVGVAPAGFQGLNEMLGCGRLDADDDVSAGVSQYALVEPAARLDVGGALAGSNRASAGPRPKLI